MFLMAQVEFLFTMLLMLEGVLKPIIYKLFTLLFSFLISHTGAKILTTKKIFSSTKLFTL